MPHSLGRRWESTSASNSTPTTTIHNPPDALRRSAAPPTVATSLASFAARELKHSELRTHYGVRTTSLPLDLTLQHTQTQQVVHESPPSPLTRRNRQRQPRAHQSKGPPACPPSPLRPLLSTWSCSAAKRPRRQSMTPTQKTGEQKTERKYRRPGQLRRNNSGRSTPPLCKSGTKSCHPALRYRTTAFFCVPKSCLTRF